MALFGLLGKKKKELTDKISRAYNDDASVLGMAKNTVKGTGKMIGEIFMGDRDPIPTFNTQNEKFSETPLKTGAKRTFNFVAGIPNAIIRKGVTENASDLGRNIGLLASGRQPLKYNELKGGAARLGYHISGRGSGRAQDVLGDVGKTVDPIISAYGGGKVLGLGKNAVDNFAKQTLTKTMKQGAKFGATTGGIQGVSMGLDENRDKSVGEQLWGATKSGAGSAIAGGILGGSVPAVGTLSKAIRGSLANRTPQRTQTDIIPEHWVRSGEKVYPDNLTGKMEVPKGHRLVGEPIPTMAGSGKPFYQKTEKFVPEQKITRTLSERDPDLKDWGAGVRDALPRPGMSIQAVDDPLISQARKYKSAEEFVRDFYGQVKNWKPEEGGYSFGHVPVEDTHMYPAKQYSYFVKNGGDKSLDYWKKRISEGKGITPIIVEPGMFKTRTGSQSWYVRDGLHRLAAAEEMGIKNIPAIILDSKSSRLSRDFGKFSDGELSSQLIDIWNKANEGKTPSDLGKEFVGALPRPGMTIKDVSGGKPSVSLPLLPEARPIKNVIVPINKKLRRLENAERIQKRVIDKMNKDRYQKAKEEYFNEKMANEFKTNPIDYTTGEDFSSQYASFRDFMRQAYRGRNRDLIDTGDAITLQKLTESGRIKRADGNPLTKTDVDNFLYSQNKTDNEVLDFFKELMDKEIEAKNIKFNRPEKIPYLDKNPKIEELRSKRENMIEAANAELQVVKTPEVLLPDDYRTTKVTKEEELSRVAKEIGDTPYKDIASLSVGFRDVYRNFERFFREDAPRMIAKYIRPLEKGKEIMYRNLSQHADELERDVVKGLGIRKGSAESAAVQEFGEGARDYASLVKQFGKQKADNIVQADKWFRAKYDGLLEQVNKVRAQVYPNNPEKIVSRRDDYYRHFREMKEGLGGLMNLFETPAGIDNRLAGLSDNTKPNAKWASFMQRRLGMKTDIDAVGGFIDYVRSAEYAKNVDPTIKGFRELRNALALQGNDKKANYNNFLTFLDSFSGDLAGKTNDLDRGMQKMTGRKVFGVIDWVNRRVKSNTILANASSSVAQIFAVPKGIAMAGEKNYTKGLYRLAKGLFSKNEPMAQSQFLNERFYGDFDRFDDKLIQQPKKLAVWMITALDELGTKANWNAFYEQAVARGVNNPIRYADDMARRIVGGRGIGEVPLAQKSRIFQTIAPFTLEVVNDWYVWAELAKKGGVPLVKGAVYTFLFNRAAEQLRGSGVAFDPINAVKEGWQNAQEEEGIKDKSLAFGGRVSGEVLSNVPLGTLAANLYPQYGVKNDNGEQVLPSREKFFGQGDPTRFGGGLLAIKGVSDPLYNLLPPFGGKQLQKTLEGVKTVNQGYSEAGSGNVAFPVERSARNYLQSGIFGKYSLPEARQFFDEERSPLSKKQSEIFRASGGANYDAVMQERAKNKEIAQLREGKTPNIQTANAQELGSGMVSLFDGSVYVQSLDKTFKTPKEAALAVKKVDFAQSGENFRDGGDVVYRRNVDGSVTVQRKTEYTDDLLYRRMNMANDAKDVATWKMYAEQKYQNLQAMLNDPSLDELERLNIQDKIDTLIRDFAKKGSGGSGSGSGGSRSAKNPYRNIHTFDPSIDLPFIPKVRKPRLFTRTSPLRMPRTRKINRLKFK